MSKIAAECFYQSSSHIVMITFYNSLPLWATMIDVFTRYFYSLYDSEKQVPGSYLSKRLTIRFPVSAILFTHLLFHTHF